MKHNVADQLKIIRLAIRLQLLQNAERALRFAADMRERSRRRS